jgi:hypothetical protein
MLRLTLLPLIAALLLAPLSTAQESDAGCTESSPCDWIFDVDENGFIGVPEEGWTFRQGDWVQVNIFNLDLAEQTHTITLDGYNRSWTLGPYQEITAGPFLLHLAGTFILHDDPTDDTASVFVAETTPVTGGNDPLPQEEDPSNGPLPSEEDPAYGEGAPDRATPPAGTLLVAIALLVGAAVVRHRR